MICYLNLFFWFLDFYQIWFIFFNLWWWIIDFIKGNDCIDTFLKIHIDVLNLNFKVFMKIKKENTTKRSSIMFQSNQFHLRFICGSLWLGYCSLSKVCLCSLMKFLL
jgi:hypothetical protein